MWGPVGASSVSQYARIPPRLRPARRACAATGRARCARLAAEQGLPGQHHFYITFRTDHPGVVMDDSLRARYPTEMTIVLQHDSGGSRSSRSASA